MCSRSSARVLSAAVGRGCAVCNRAHPGLADELETSSQEDRSIASEPSLLPFHYSPAFGPPSTRTKSGGRNARTKVWSQLTFST